MVAKRKKRLGAFYTPAEVAQVIASSVITASSEYVLEPSFGGGVFIGAALDRLAALGSKFSTNQVFGVDIDRGAFRSIESAEIKVSQKNLIRADFLRLSPGTFGRKFDVILGNPPYVGHERIPIRAREAYWAGAAAEGFHVPGKPSTWIYFVLKSLSFLEEGGSLAYVVPFSVSKSIPARYLVEILAARFERVEIVLIESELFLESGTRERVALLLAEKFRSAGVIHEHCTRLRCKDISEASHLLSRLRESDGGRGLKDAHEEARARLDEFISTEGGRCLKDVAEISIGLVLGDSNKFLVSNEVRKRIDPKGRLTKRCLRKLSYVKSMIFTKADFDELDSAGYPTRVITVNERHSLSKEMKAHLNEGLDKKSISANRTYQKRQPWYSISAGSPPDAFFKFFSQVGPELVLNKAGVLCTNSIYAVYFDENKAALRDVYALLIGVVSTVGQLYSEVIGGRYGPGALKLNVADAAGMPYLNLRLATLGGLEACVKEVDEAIRSGNRDLAREIADRFLIDHIVGGREFGLLQSTLVALRTQRNGKARNVEDEA